MAGWVKLKRVAKRTPNGMDAAPQHFSAYEVDPSGAYKCPLCRVGKGSSPESDSGWVNCPMVDRVICLGCCLDYQYVARSNEFTEHPYYEDFVRFSEMTNKSVTELRSCCLEHQQSVLEGELESGASRELERPMRELLEVVKTRLKAL